MDNCWAKIGQTDFEAIEQFFFFGYNWDVIISSIPDGFNRWIHIWIHFLTTIESTLSREIEIRNEAIKDNKMPIYTDESKEQDLMFYVNTYIFGTQI